MGKEAQKAAGYLMAAAFALTIIIFVFSSASLLRGQEFRENMLEAGVQVAGALFVVTVFVERLAVVASLIWGEAQRTAELRLLEATNSDAMVDAEQEVARLLTLRERLRLLLGFIVGIFVSAAGIRALEGLLVISNERAVDRLLYPVDVLLTAGLIAGGSNGLAFLIQLLKQRIAPSLNPEAERLRVRLETTT